MLCLIRQDLLWAQSEIFPGAGYCSKSASVDGTGLCWGLNAPAESTSRARTVLGLVFTEVPSAGAQGSLVSMGHSCKGALCGFQNVCWCQATFFWVSHA